LSFYLDTNKGYSLADKSANSLQRVIAWLAVYYFKYVYSAGLQIIQFSKSYKTYNSAKFYVVNIHFTHLGKTILMKGFSLGFGRETLKLVG